MTTINSSASGYSGLVHKPRMKQDQLHKEELLALLFMKTFNLEKTSDNVRIIKLLPLIE